MGTWPGQTLAAKACTGRPASLLSFALKMSRELMCPFELFLILLRQHLLQKKCSTTAFFFY